MGRGVGLEMGLRLPSEKWDCTNSFVQLIVNNSYILYTNCIVPIHTTSAQREPRGRSPSTPPSPTRLHPAAPTLGYTRLRPDQLGCVHGGVGLEMGLWLPSEKWDCTNSFVQHSQPLPSLKYPTCPRQALWRCCMPQRIGEGSDARLKPKSTT